MTALRKTRVLCIGHPYILAINRAVARELARDPAFAVTVAAPKAFSGDLRALRLEPEQPDSPLQVVGLDSYGSGFIHLFRFSRRGLRDLLRAGSFDIVYAWMEPFVYAGWQLSRAVPVGSGTKLCYRTAQNIHKVYPPPFRFFEKQCVRRANGWLACGQLVFEIMVRRGYDPARGANIPLAVDTTAFAPLTLAARDDVLTELGLGAPVVCYLGRLVPEKGIRILLRALELLPVEQEWSLLCLGSGPEETSILRWARDHGWQDRVRVKLVNHHDVPRYLGVADLLVAPSQTTPRWKEQFGRMIVEAFASGVPVIGSDSGEIPYVIGPAGMVVPEGDAAAWANAINALLTESGRREEFKRLGLTRAARFSAANIAREYGSYFRRMMGQPGGDPVHCG